MANGRTVFSPRHKWRNFYLALIAAGGGQIDRNTVCRLVGWSEDPVANGREISRHLKSAQVSRLPTPLIVSERPTVAWALHPDWAVELRTEHRRIDVGQLEKRAGYRTVVDRLDLAEMGRLCKLCDAQLDFYAGHVRKSFDAMRVLAVGHDSTELRAICLFWLIRIGIRLPQDDTILDMIDDADAALAGLAPMHLTNCLRDRLAIIRTLHSSPSEWPAIAADLANRAHVMVPTPDLVSLAYVQNYLALARRRMGQAWLAYTAIIPGIHYALASGDPHLHQIVLFNAALILSSIAEKIETGPTGGDLALPGEQNSARLVDAALGALSVVSRISHEFGIGRESCQCEILAAELHLKLNQYDRAKQYIDLATRMNKTSGSIGDRAALAHCEAHYLAAREGNSPEDRRAIARLLDEASDLFMQCNRDDMVARVRQDRKNLLNSGRRRQSLI
jgi:hypothetical protein